MKAVLPKLLENYIEASNENDVKKFISCFAKSASVHDEGEMRTGMDQITQWFINTRRKYKFKMEPLHLEDHTDKVLLTARVSGDFPGSPINLTYKFKIESGLIQEVGIS